MLNKHSFSRENICNHSGGVPRKIPSYLLNKQHVVYNAHKRHCAFIIQTKTKNLNSNIVFWCKLWNKDTQEKYFGNNIC